MGRKYELTVIYREAEEERREGIAFLEDVLSRHGASILTRNEIGVRKLAYEIDKRQRGFYVFYFLEADTGAIANITKELNMSHLLLRYLFVEKPDLRPGQIARRQEKERKMRDFLALKARRSAPAAPTVLDKDKEAEEMQEEARLPGKEDSDE